MRSRDGNCVTPQVTRNMYLYRAPTQHVETIPARYVSNPKVHLNYVFVRTQNAVGGSRPVVVPPPKQKTLVYVLNRRPSTAQQEVIEVPSAPTRPELFFVNYDEGDDAQLPGGVSLQEALSQSVQQGQTIHGRGGFSSSGGFSSGVSSGGQYSSNTFSEGSNFSAGGRGSIIGVGGAATNVGPYQ